MSAVFVRAKTSDGRWASVDAADLDERSFREFILRKLADCEIVVCIKDLAMPNLTTPLTKAQAEEKI